MSLLHHSDFPQRAFNRHLFARAAPGWGRYVFRPRLWPSLAVILLLPLLLGLGQWQLQRAADKAALQAEWDARRQAPPQLLDGHPADGAALRFHPLIARGTYEAEHQIFLDNQVYRGQAGYHVLTPLRLAGSDTRVLVDRGWIAAPAERNGLPRAAVPIGEVEVRGLGALPPRRTLELAPASGDAWQSPWQTVDFQRFRQLTGQPLQALLLQLDPEEAGGYVRDWPRPDLGRERHLAYAWQWFAFAATLVVLWLVTNLERRT